MSKPKILIVEDETIIAMELAMQLHGLGYEPVGHATQGQQAIEMAGQLRPDLVLMDIYLAGAMGGITAAKIIRILYGVPSVFLSAFAETAFTGSDNLAQAELDEPAGYLSKPYEAHELHAVIEAALKR